MGRIEARIVAGIALGLALTVIPAVGLVPGAGALVGQETPEDTTRGPADAKDEERPYGPSEVLGCDFGFAVLASTVGEPATVRACPRGGGDRDAYFGPTPIVEARHVDSVTGGSDGTGGREVAAGARAWRGDRLWRFEWAPRPGGQLDTVFHAAGADVEKGCAPDDLDCWRDKHRAREVVLDTLRRDPGTGADAAGVLVARTAVRWSPGTEVATLGLDLVFRPTDEEEPMVLRPLDDWSYGISFYVPSRRGSWVPIPGTGGWLDAAAGPVHGEVRPAEGRLATLEASVPGERVTAGDGEPGSKREVRVEPGGYLVTRTGDGAVWLREERPADFELGCRRISDTAAAVADERPDPELFRVAIADLFRSGDGTPVLRDSYPRGC